MVEFKTRRGKDLKRFALEHSHLVKEMIAKPSEFNFKNEAKQIEAVERSAMTAVRFMRFALDAEGLAVGI